MASASSVKARGRGAAQREEHAAAISLLAGALVWGLIWYPYRVLRDAGIDGVVASTATYGVAFIVGLFCFGPRLAAVTPSWTLFWLALASGGCNLGYVLATLDGEVVRVLLLFYLAPLWTVLLAHALLGERLNRLGACIVALSLAGAATMLWNPRIGLPLPQAGADWIGLGAGFSFALLNVLSRRAQAVSIEVKSMTAFAGSILAGAMLVLAGFGQPRMPNTLSQWLLLGAIGSILAAANLVVQYGLARMPANRAIVIMLSEVGFAALASWILADESIGFREWIGGAMIVVASLLSAKMERAGGDA